MLFNIFSISQTPQEQTGSVFLFFGNLSAKVIDLSFSVNVFLTLFSAGLKVTILKAIFSSRADMWNYCSFLQSHSHLINISESC